MRYTVPAVEEPQSAARRAAVVRAPAAGPPSTTGPANGAGRARTGGTGTATAARPAATRSAPCSGTSPITPASIGPISRPTPFLTFMRASAETARREPRSTCVGAPVKKDARGALQQLRDHGDDQCLAQPEHHARHQQQEERRQHEGPGREAVHEHAHAPAREELRHAGRGDEEADGGQRVPGRRRDERYEHRSPTQRAREHQDHGSERARPLERARPPSSASILGFPSARAARPLLYRVPPLTAAAEVRDGAQSSIRSPKISDLIVTGTVPDGRRSRPRST